MNNIKVFFINNRIVSILISILFIWNVIISIKLNHEHDYAEEYHEHDYAEVYHEHDYAEEYHEHDYAEEYHDH